MPCQQEAANFGFSGPCKGPGLALEAQTGWGKHWIKSQSPGFEVPDLPQTSWPYPCICFPVCEMGMVAEVFHKYHERYIKMVGYVTVIVDGKESIPLE